MVPNNIEIDVSIYPIFWGLPLNSGGGAFFNSKSNAFVHEASHAACGTKDLALGIWAAQDLADGPQARQFRIPTVYQYFGLSGCDEKGCCGVSRCLRALLQKGSRNLGETTSQSQSRSTMDTTSRVYSSSDMFT